MHPEASRAWETHRPGRDLGHSGVCVAPSVSIELDPTGWVYGCCANQLYPLGRIGVDRLPDLWNGPRARVLREALDRWDMSVGCGSCRWHIEHGRMDPDAAVYDRFPVADQTLDGPQTMTFALSNRCNLGCLMCSPELSSTLRNQAGLPAIRNPYDDVFFDDLAAFLPGLRYAKFLGGEPFLIQEHHRIWDLMAEVGGPPRMQVTTNGTIWNDRVEQLLDSFRVDVTVSIDGATTGTYEAIRRGASFETVAANVDRFANAARRNGTELRFCFCLMEQNSHELADMLRWADRLDAPVSVNVVTDLGFALHDLPAGELGTVLDGWRLDEEAGGFNLNAEVWATQVLQLETVLAERRAERPRPARQAQQPAEPILVVPSQSTFEDPPEDETVERDRLSDWASGGPVGVFRGRTDGTLIEVVARLPRLGLNEQLVGRRLDDVVPWIEAADGRPAWLIGVEDEQEGRIVRTVVLSAEQPVRGKPASVVRFVLLPAVSGFTVLVAEDRIYDREEPEEVPVAAPRLAAGHDYVGGTEPPVA